MSGIRQGAVEKESLKLQISNDGEEFVDLSYECEPATTWTEAVAKFYIPEPDVMYLRIVAPEGYWIDDLRVQEGNEGEGQEVVYSVGGDDGREFGYVYFQDDFSWVTEDYKGTDYIAGWPSNTAETYWNGVTAATHGQTAYDALIASGWTTDDNKLKERVYLRIGYLKMGRAANVAGCGGGVVSPALPDQEELRGDGQGVVRLLRLFQYRRHVGSDDDHAGASDRRRYDQRR